MTRERQREKYLERQARAEAAARDTYRGAAKAPTIDAMRAEFLDGDNEAILLQQLGRLDARDPAQWDPINVRYEARVETFAEAFAVVAKAAKRDWRRFDLEVFRECAGLAKLSLPERLMVAQADAETIEHYDALRAQQDRKITTLDEIAEAGGYQIIYADPPWSYNQRGRGAAENHYETMSIDDLEQLPIERLAAENAVLFLWATMPLLPEAIDLGRAWGFCVSPETRILTKDLRWLPAEELRVGHDLVGFDENPRPTVTGFGKRRYFDWSGVTSTGIEKLDSCEVRLADGTRLFCSMDHPWLVRAVKRGDGPRRQGLTQWMRSRDMITALKNERRTRALMMPRLVPVTSPRTDYIGGFLSAAFDGEGCLRKQDGQGPGLGFAQNTNPFLAQTIDYLNRAGYPVNTYSYPTKKRPGINHVNIRAGVASTIRFLSEMRPPRLLDNWGKLDLRRASLYNANQDELEIVEVIPRSKQWMCTLSTSSQTYIAEGFGAHNTYKTCAFTWIKHYEPSGKPAMGGGMWTRANAELCLLFVRGEPPRRVSRAVRQLVETGPDDKIVCDDGVTVPDYNGSPTCECGHSRSVHLEDPSGYEGNLCIHVKAKELQDCGCNGYKPMYVPQVVGDVLRAPRGSHSAKPVEVRRRIDALMGEGPSRVELFARERADGWDAWGAEVPGGSDFELGDER